MYQIGTKVQVFNKSFKMWTHGFSIHSIENDKIQIKRISDNSVIPATFKLEEITISPKK